MSDGHKGMAAALILTSVCAWVLHSAEARGPDVQVRCVFGQDCVLPCNIPSPLVTLRVSWYKQDMLVLSFPPSSETPSLAYSGRVSMISQLIANGSASLHLQQVSTQDRGIYRCTVTNGNSTQVTQILLKVEAPIRLLTLEMTRQGGYKQLRCACQEIFPTPYVWWSTEPPVQPGRLKPITHKSVDERGLFSVESKLEQIGNLSDYKYICKINSTYGSHIWTASLQEKELAITEGNKVTIPCTAPNHLANFTLTWSFTRSDQPDQILTFDSHSRQVSNRWESRVQVDPKRILAGDGTLRLQDVGQQSHTGTYTCTVTSAQSRQVLHTWVNIKPKGEKPHKGEQSRFWPIAVVMTALVLSITALVWCLRRKDKRSLRQEADGTETELQPVKAERVRSRSPPEERRLTVDQTNGDA